jgi:proline-specific peptidase
VEFHGKRIRSDTFEGTMDVIGGRVWFRVVGADGPGTPLLTVHGGPGGAHDYLEPLEALADERPIIFYDQLGCGLSDRPEDGSLWTLERFVDELAQVRSSLDLRHVHILGQSWGTMLLSEYVRRCGSDGVSSMVMSGPAIDARMFVEGARSYIPELSKGSRQAIEEGESSSRYDDPAYQRAMNDFYHRHVCRLDPWPECLNRTVSKMGTAVYLKMWGPSEFTCTGTLRDLDNTQTLRELRTPTLFTCGEFDEATPEATRHYSALTPGSEYVMFRGIAHAPSGANGRISWDGTGFPEVQRSTNGLRALVSDGACIGND